MATITVWMNVWEAVLLIINAILAIILNCVIVYLVIHVRSLRSSFNTTIVNASVADIIVSLNILISTIDIISENGKSISNMVWCDFTGFINLISFVASVMSLAAVSINRYVLVCKSQLYGELFTQTGTAVYIFLVWFISALLSCHLSLVGQDFLITRVSPSASPTGSSKSYMLFMIFICFCGPITATLVTLFLIVRTKRKTEASLAGQYTGSPRDISPATMLANRRARRNEKSERQITLSIVLVVFVFFVAWGPFVIVMFLDVFGDNKVPRWLDMGSFLFGCFNSTANPVVYISVNRNFRRAVRQKLGLTSSVGLSPSSRAQNSVVGSKPAFVVRT
ncbi:LOW QUALITY PROTEIN: melatonin receptor type 1A-like [Rhopilema esculentum]|uniref:LOW QUALITY PROTEIN: melatonin receptor type 1A-like n=1 Tax=Rhopilema esculentum TaxID=499914 RepID=UPI0031CFB006